MSEKKLTKEEVAELRAWQTSEKKKKAVNNRIQKKFDSYRRVEHISKNVRTKHRNKPVSMSIPVSMSGNIPDKIRFMPSLWLCTDNEREYVKKWTVAKMNFEKAIRPIQKWVAAKNLGSDVSEDIKLKVRNLDEDLFAYFETLTDERELQEVIPYVNGSVSGAMNYLDGFPRKVGMIAIEEAILADVYPSLIKDDITEADKPIESPLSAKQKAEAEEAPAMNFVPSNINLDEDEEEGGGVSSSSVLGGF